MASLKMIIGNPIQKTIQSTSLFNDSPWSCSHIKIKLIHLFTLEIYARKHQESELCLFFVIFNQILN